MICQIFTTIYNIVLYTSVSLLLSIPSDSSAFLFDGHLSAATTKSPQHRPHLHYCSRSATTRGGIATKMDTTAQSSPAVEGSASSASDGTGPPVIAGESQLRVRNTDEGYELNGLLTVKHTGSRSVWVLCHGLCSSLYGMVPSFVSKELDTNTFRFDFAGCGQSGGEWKYAGYDREVADLRAVISHLRELGWAVNCILGHSKGAAAVLQYGEKYDDVPLIVNVCGRFDTSKTPRSRFSEEQWHQLEETGAFMWNIKGKNLPITQNDFDERAALDMKRTAHAIKRSKVLTIHGTKDETIPVTDAYEFNKLIAQHELVVVDDATHRFATEPEQTAVLKALARYVQK